jgi:hypothetical protein
MRMPEHVVVAPGAALTGVAALAATAPPLVLAQAGTMNEPSEPAPPAPLPTMPKSVTIATPSSVGQQIQAEVRRALGHVVKQHDIVALTDNDGPVTRDMVRSCIACDFARHDLHGMDLSHLSLVGDDFCTRICAA